MADDFETWTRELKGILNAVAEATKALGIADEAAADRARGLVVDIVRRVRAANLTAAKLGVPLLSVPGEKPEVDLRPFWSRLLDKISSQARRHTAGQGLETLRMEADAALLQAPSLAKR